MSETPRTPRVGVVLLNYTHAGKTLSCVASLQQLTHPAVRIYVVDNASPDDSWEKLEAYLVTHPGAFTLIQSGHNLGFSGGNNLGIEAAFSEGASFVWVLNNDTTVEPNTLTELLRVADKTNGLVGATLYYPEGHFQQVGTQINWWTGKTRGLPEKKARVRSQQTGYGEVDCLTGASILIPKAVFEKIGPWSEPYFLYFEDAEYTMRARRAEVAVHFAINATVYHEEGATTGRKSAATQYYYHRNRLQFLMTYANPLQKLTILGYSGIRLCRTVLKTMLPSKKETFSARRLALQIQWRAMCDWAQGRLGPCSP